MQIGLNEFRELVSKFAAAPELPVLNTRHTELKTLDPYPNVPPALLHAGHIASYAIITGMIDPFDSLAIEKPATYLVPLEGPVRYLDDSGVSRSFYLSNQKIAGEADVRSEFTLAPNSICYVTLKPTFRMPAYIAGRFNLLIKDVYRGLLVGTGPLVDPGFVGLLSVPVHNFTANSYSFRAGDGFVYFEFTKLSWKNPSDLEVPSWIPKAIEFQPPFPASKNERKTLDDYIQLATGSGPPQNAIHTQVRRLSKVNSQVKKRLRFFTVSAYVAGIALLLAAAGVIVAAWQLYLGAQQFTQAAQKDVSDAHEKLNSEIKSVRMEFENLKNIKPPVMPTSFPPSPPPAKK